MIQTLVATSMFAVEETRKLWQAKNIYSYFSIANIS